MSSNLTSGHIVPKQMSKIDTSGHIVTKQMSSNLTSGHIVPKSEPENLNVLSDKKGWVSVSGENDSNESLKKSVNNESYMFILNKEEYIKKNKSSKSLEGFSLSPSARLSNEECQVVQHSVGKSQRFKVYADEILQTSSSKYLRDDLIRFANTVVFDSGDMSIIQNYVVGQIKSKFNSSPKQHAYGEDLVGFFNTAWEGAVELYVSGVRQYVDGTEDSMTTDDFCRLKHDEYFAQFPFFISLIFRDFNFLLEFIAVSDKSEATFKAP